MEINVFKKIKDKKQAKKEALQQAKQTAKAERHKDDAEKIYYSKQIKNLYYDILGKDRTVNGEN